jgi:HemK-related putative methylase
MSENSYDDTLVGMQALLDKSQAAKAGRTAKVSGLKLTVPEGVFSPDYFYDSGFFAEAVSKLVGFGQTFLEIGPGTGIVSIKCAKRGAIVTCVDINPNAVSATLVNAKLNGVNLEVYEGDLFSPLGEDRKFDYIFWNVPFGLVQYGELDILQRAIFDVGYETIRKFIVEAKIRLTTNGRLLIGFSKKLGNYDLLEQIAGDNGNRLSIVEEGTDADNIAYQLIEVLPGEG